MKVEITYGKCQVGPYAGLWYVRVWTDLFGCISNTWSENGPEKAEALAQSMRASEVTIEEKDVDR